MAHPLVDQLRFTRREFLRALDGVPDKDGERRLDPMNSISWNVGHLAWHEQLYWLQFAQGELLRPDIEERFRYGAPGITPPLGEMREAWENITKASDPWLDEVTMATLVTNLVRDGKPTDYFWGSLLQRLIYHYWYHTGENMAIRQSLGHPGLPDFVGAIEVEAPYRPETS